MVSLCLWFSSWKRRGLSHHRPGKRIHKGRTSCSVLAVPVVVCRDINIPPEKSGLCSNYSVIFTRNDTKGLKSPAAWAGCRGRKSRGLRLGLSLQLKQMRSSQAALLGGCECGLGVAGSAVLPRLQSAGIQDSLGTLGSWGSSRARWRGTLGFWSCVFVPEGVWLEQVFLPQLTCREAGARTSGKFQEAEPGAWAWQSCRKTGRRSSPA